MKSKVTKKVFAILLIFAIACSFGITTYAARDFSDRVGDPTATVYEQAPAGEEDSESGKSPDCGMSGVKRTCCRTDGSNGYCIVRTSIM